METIAPDVVKELLASYEPKAVPAAYMRLSNPCLALTASACCFEKNEMRRLCHCTREKQPLEQLETGKAWQLKKQTPAT